MACWAVAGLQQLFGSASYCNAVNQLFPTVMFTKELGQEHVSQGQDPWTFPTFYSSQLTFTSTPESVLKSLWHGQGYASTLASPWSHRCTTWKVGVEFLQ